MLLSWLRKQFWRCAACAAPARTTFCPPCAQSLQRATQTRGAGSWVAGYEYGAALARAICRAKYGGRSELWFPLAGALGHLHPLVRAWNPDCLVPIASHPQRLAARGYNPAAMLARGLGQTLEIPVNTSNLIRTRCPPPQASLGRAARLRGPVGSFAVVRSELRGARVVLVDDVRTTGATFADARRALTEAGVLSCLELSLAVSET